MGNNKNIESEFSKLPEEVSLKEIILKIIGFGKEIWNKKFLILLISAIVGGVAFFRSDEPVTEYESHINFIVNQQALTSTSEKINAILGLNSDMQFGKIIEILKSSKVIHPVLTREINVAEKSEIVANLLLKDVGRKPIELSSSDPEKLSRKELITLSNIHKNFLYKNLTIEHNPVSTALLLKIKTQNQELSTELIDLIYNEFTGFYAYQTIGKPMENFKKLKKRRDSLEWKMKALEKEQARAQDKSMGITSRKSLLYMNDIVRDLQSTSALYAEVNKGMQDLEFTLSSKGPEFQILDRSYIPIRITEDSKIKKAIIAAIIGMILTIIIVVLAKIVKDALNS